VEVTCALSTLPRNVSYSDAGKAAALSCGGGNVPIAIDVLFSTYGTVVCNYVRPSTSPPLSCYCTPGVRGRG